MKIIKKSIIVTKQVIMIGIMLTCQILLGDSLIVNSSSQITVSGIYKYNNKLDITFDIEGRIIGFFGKTGYYIDSE